MVDDRQWLDGNADVTLDHIKRCALEGVRLPPSILAALLPITNDGTKP